MSKSPAPSKATPSAPEPKAERLYKRLKNEAGGFSRMPSLDEMLDEMSENDDYETRPGSYHFSNLMRCFRWQWYKLKDTPCDHGVPVKQCKEHRFDAGKAKPGNGTEDAIRKLYADVLNYGRLDGPILNDVRFSIPVEVTWDEEEESQKKPGKYITRSKKQTVYLTGKSDTLIQGDNGIIIGFTELKTPISEFFPKKITDLTKACGTKRLPLTLAGIQEPDNPQGVVSLHQLTQAGVGMKVLEMHNRKPELGVLQTVSRSNWRDHIEIIVTPEEWDLLYNLAVWYVKEAHINAQFPEAPAPEFFLGWECGYCPFNDRCAKENQRNDQQRVIHPTVPGINNRVRALHGMDPKEKSAPKPKKKRGAK